MTEVDVCDPNHGEVQIRGLACGVCAWDVHIFKHGCDWPAGPGHEGIGQITKIGEGVSGFSEGDWVTAIGMGFTETVNMPAYSLVRVPHNDARPEDWIVEPVSCIVTGLDHCALRAGDRIAVLGCGFMGQMFLQALARSLVSELIAIDIDPARLTMAREWGATQCIDASSVDINALQARSIDTVVDCSGSQSGLDLASKIVRRGGRLNLFGWNHGIGQFPGDLWHMHGLTVVNSAPNSAVRDPWPVAIRLLECKLIRLRPLVSHVVPLDDYPSLLAIAAAKGSGYLKGVVKLAG